MSSSVLPLAGALGCAVCYGTGSVLQAKSARRVDTGQGGLDPHLAGRVLRQGPYLAGLGLDAVGFALSLAALRSLPLFVVQAAVASNVAVIALLAGPVLGERPRRGSAWAVTAVVVGLGLLGAAAQPGPAAAVPGWLRWGAVALAVAAVAAGVPAARSSGRRSAAVLGGLAGLANAAVGIGARIWRDPFNVGVLLHDPATLAVVIGGVGGLWMYTVALQRGSATGATALLVVVEAAVPAVVGLVWLGDRARPGFGLVAVAGFVVALVASVWLSGVVAQVEHPSG